MSNGLFRRMEAISDRIPKKLVDGLYYAAVLLIFIYDDAFLTRFDREPFKYLYVAGIALSGVVLCIRALNLRRMIAERKGTVFFAILLLLAGIGYFFIRRSFYFLALALLMVGAYEADSKKIFVLALIAAAALFAVMLAKFSLDNPGWLRYTRANFGSINTTDCQGMVFFLVLVFLFVRGGRITYPEVILLAGVVLFFWKYTHAEWNMYCAMASLLIALLIKTGAVLGVQPGEEKRQILGYVISASFVICAAVMVFLSILYDPENENWVTLNGLLHNRLGVPHDMIFLYPPRIWGNEYVEVGWGYDPNVNIKQAIAQYGYTYIDSSYPNILIKHGYLIFAMLIGSLTYVSFRFAKRGELYAVLLLSVLAISFAGEGHLKDLSCNIWLLLPFAELAFPQCEKGQLKKRRENKEAG